MIKGTTFKAREGYAFESPSLELGVLCTEGQPDTTVPIRIPLSMVTRHMLVTGSTGAGKTKTLQALLEQLSAAGVPSFVPDLKGDLSGLSEPGEETDRLRQRNDSIGQDWKPASFPVEYLQLGTGPGLPICATVQSFGAQLLARIMELTAVQTSVLEMIFIWAERNGLPLYTLQDLHATLSYLLSSEGKEHLRTEIGGASNASIGVIQRGVVVLAGRGADQFFGNPHFDVRDLLRVDDDGRGFINVMELPNVMRQPVLFSTFLLWLLTELSREDVLPEIGDVDLPKLVFVLDEAHLLFQDASKAFQRIVIQTLRLVRSKGIAVIVASQSATDLPREVLGQLGSRVQHALHAHTPEDHSALKKVVATFPDSGYDLQKLLTSLPIGHAVVSVLGENGAPTPVVWTVLRSPQSKMAPVAQETMREMTEASWLSAKYCAEYMASRERVGAYDMLK